MNIVLPEKFYFKGASRENFARVEDGNLVIRGTVPFKKMMYDLAYKISGTTKCFYDKFLWVWLLEFIRPEQKFKDIVHLQEQISKDIAYVKALNKKDVVEDNMLLPKPF